MEPVGTFDKGLYIKYAAYHHIPQLSKPEKKSFTDIRQSDGCAFLRITLPSTA